MYGRQQSQSHAYSVITDGAPIRVPRFFSNQRRCDGWTLIELVIVLVVAALLVYFAVRSFQPKAAIALEQAERLRDDVRHTQMLAITWNQALRINVLAGSYSVQCVVAGVAPCNVNPVIDPATGSPYQVNLQQGLALAGPGFTMRLDMLGRPRNNATAALILAPATYRITGGGPERTVVVTQLTGFVTAQ